jgi:hypothetical protein
VGGVMDVVAEAFARACGWWMAWMVCLEGACARGGQGVLCLDGATQHGCRMHDLSCSCHPSRSDQTAACVSICVDNATVLGEGQASDQAALQ